MFFKIHASTRGNKTATPYRNAWRCEGRNILEPIGVHHAYDPSRGRFIGGVRQKSNQYLLNTFETTGEYKPSFTDVQFLGTMEAGKKVELEVS